MASTTKLFDITAGGVEVAAPATGRKHVVQDMIISNEGSYLDPVFEDNETDLPFYIGTTLRDSSTSYDDRQGVMTVQLSDDLTVVAFPDRESRAGRIHLQALRVDRTKKTARPGVPLNTGAGRLSPQQGVLSPLVRASATTFLAPDFTRNGWLISYAVDPVTLQITPIGTVNRGPQSLSSEYFSGDYVSDGVCLCSLTDGGNTRIVRVDVPTDAAPTVTNVATYAASAYPARLVRAHDTDLSFAHVIASTDSNFVECRFDFDPATNTVSNTTYQNLFFSGTSTTQLGAGGSLYWDVFSMYEPGGYGFMIVYNSQTSPYPVVSKLYTSATGSASDQNHGNATPGVYPVAIPCGRDMVILQSQSAGSGRNYTSSNMRIVRDGATVAISSDTGLFHRINGANVVVGFEGCALSTTVYPGGSGGNVGDDAYIGKTGLPETGAVLGYGIMHASRVSYVGALDAYLICRGQGVQIIDRDFNLIASGYRSGFFIWSVAVDPQDETKFYYMRSAEMRVEQDGGHACHLATAEIPKRPGAVISDIAPTQVLPGSYNFYRTGAFLKPYANGTVGVVYLGYNGSSYGVVSADYEITVGLVTGSNHATSSISSMFFGELGAIQTDDRSVIVSHYDNNSYRRVEAKSATGPFTNLVSSGNAVQSGLTPTVPISHSGKYVGLIVDEHFAVVVPDMDAAAPSRILFNTYTGAPNLVGATAYAAAIQGRVVYVDYVRNGTDVYRRYKFENGEAKIIASDDTAATRSLAPRMNYVLSDTDNYFRSVTGPRQRVYDFVPGDRTFTVTQTADLKTKSMDTIENQAIPMNTKQRLETGTIVVPGEAMILKADVDGALRALVTVVETSD